ncbi:DUF6754 domain-containing protein [Candidatus Viridilinea mediisalina]|uniref:DUF6754 domain-containing protein n=1 Tax=Candidatus Viridilinea mediisalina TaxID=2024553 RepID=A0A2A6RLW0_9CHLR|nr:DUF6754 domain-containing protein [Candidatus Viridilinea mediisalina]PDW03858.1 hypothetical protein CJ255_06815 [Candidatus Viridilinea mediisalina]
MLFSSVTIIVLFIVVAMTFIHHARVQAGKLPQRRPLPALDRLRHALGHGAETGRPTHVSPGASVLGAADGSRATTAELLAGLLVAERVASEAALKGSPILVSSGDAVAHLALRGGVRQAYQMAGQAQDYDPTRVQLLAHNDELAYATGVATIYAREELEASAMFGGFNQEFLLLGEEAAQRDLPHIVGTTNSLALPLMVLSSPSTLVGEEIYAAEAYIAPAQMAQARLLTQDLLRTTVILLLVVGFGYSLLQPFLGLPSLLGL